MKDRRPRRRLRPRWAVILPLLATLAFWCAAAVGVHRLLDDSPDVKQAVNGDLLNGADHDPR